MKLQTHLIGKLVVDNTGERIEVIILNNCKATLLNLIYRFSTEKKSNFCH